MTTSSTREPLTLLQSGQGPRALRRRRRPAADGGLRPHLGLRRDHGRAHPRQGPGAHRHDRLLAGRARRPRPQPPDQRRHRRLPGRGRRPARRARPRWPAARCWSTGPRCSTSSASSAATWPARPTRSTSGRGPSTAWPCPPACATPTGCPSPSSPPRPRPPRATTSTSGWPRPSTWSGRRRPRRRPSSAWPPTRRAAARAEEQGIIICDTKFELGFIDGALSICDEVLTPDSSRFWPADNCAPGTNPPVLRQAAPARLARGPALGQAAAPAAAARRDRVRHLGSGTSTPTSGSAGVGWPTGTVPDSGRSSEQFSVLVEVQLREGIADPAGRHHRAGAARPRLGRGVRHAGRQGVPLRHRRRRRGRRPGPGHGGGRPAAGQPGHRGVVGHRAWPTGGRPDGAADRRGHLSRDQLRARRRPGRRSASGASADLVWHGDTYGGRVRRPGPPRRVRPRRLPASGGHRPVLAGHGGGGPLRRRRRAGGRDLQRLPGADRGRAAARAPCRRTAGCGSSAPRWTVRVESLRLGAHRRRCPSAPSSASPSTTSRATTPATPTPWPSCAPRTGSSSATWTTPTARSTTSPASATADGNVVGLMPHPERASDPLLGSVDGSVLLRALLASAGAPTGPRRWARCRSAPESPDGIRLGRTDGRLSRPAWFSCGCGGSWPVGAPRR